MNGAAVLLLLAGGGLAGWFVRSATWGHCWRCLNKPCTCRHERWA